MAKRSDLSQKLTGSNAPGWRDMIPQADEVEETPKRSSRKKTTKSKAKSSAKAKADVKKVRKTYYLTGSTITRIQALADQERVGISDFVEYALARFLDMMDEGDIEMETRSKEVREIVYK